MLTTAFSTISVKALRLAICTLACSTSRTNKVKATIYHYILFIKLYEIYKAFQPLALLCGYFIYFIQFYIENTLL